MAQAGRVPRGELTVSMTPILGRAFVMGLAELGERYPDIQLHLRFTDRHVDLVADRVDVAIRVGELPSSGLIARRLFQTRWVTCAAPTYLRAHGEPRTPVELAAHRCLRFASPRGALVDWVFGPQAIALRTPVSMDFDQGDPIVAATVAGLGVCQAIDFMVEEPLRDGRLVEILAEHAAPGWPVHALCAPGQQRVPRVRALVQHLVRWGRGRQGP
jgi:LysR family transcriptional regulator for bpeEF and oprC